MPKSGAILSSAALLLTITGCGLSGAAHITKSAQHSNGYTVSGQVSTAPSASPTSSNTSTNPSSSSPVQSSSASTSPSASPSTSNNLSSWNPIIATAMNSLASSTDLPLAAPTVIPPAPGPGFGYLTAMTTQTNVSWTVHLLDTAIPLGVNNPTISQHLDSRAPYVGSFGLTLLGSSQPVSTSPQRATVLRSNNPLWLANQATAKATASQKMTVGNGGDALVATAYAYGSNYNNAKLVWYEGNWTIEIVGASAQYEQAMALSVVNYLHTHYLPPFPGLIMIDMISPSTAVGRIDWINGDQLMTVAARQPMAQNPVDTCAMAVHWAPYH